MNLSALLRTLDSAGVRLSRDGDSLCLRGKVQALPPEVIDAAKAHKPDLLSLLDGEEVSPSRLLAACNGLPHYPESPKSGKSPTAAYRFIVDAAGLDEAVKAVRRSERVAVDTETIGLDPRKGRVRLIQLATESGVYIIDCVRVDPAGLWPALAGKELVLHYAAFDLAFLWRLGFRPGTVYDTMIMSRLLTAGTKDGNRLADVAKRHLGIDMAKELQSSDWSGELTVDQLSYAAMDARTTFDLYKPLNLAIQEAGLERVAAIENRAVPAFVWLACSGAPFDAGAWEQLAIEAEAHAAALEMELNTTAPPKPPPEATGKKKPAKADPKWNWRSPQQVKAVFALLGINLTSTGDEILAAVAHPLAALLREHRKAAQLVKAFGRKWNTFAVDGRIYARWNQLGTDAGRSSCSSPNLQQVPSRNDPRYRQCFVAPPGRVLVKADFGQLQLRLAAKIAGEQRMIDAFRNGADLHQLTAQAVTGKDEITKHDRTMAKVLNFGLLFGMGAKRLREYARQDYNVDLSEREAFGLRRAFFDTYPGLTAWHQRAALERLRASMGTAKASERESRTILVLQR